MFNKSTILALLAFFICFVSAEMIELDDKKFNEVNI